MTAPARTGTGTPEGSSMIMEEFSPSLGDGLSFGGVEEREGEGVIRRVGVEEREGVGEVEN